MNFVGGISNDIKTNFRIQKYSQSDYKDYHAYLIDKRIHIGFEIFLRLLIILLSPVVLVILIIDHYQQIRLQNKKKEQIAHEKEEQKKALTEGRSFVYFEKIQGGGVSNCHGCGYTEEIIGFVNDFLRDPTPYFEGCQCQSCGAFGTIDYDGHKKISSDSAHVVDCFLIKNQSFALNLSREMCPID